MGNNQASKLEARFGELDSKNIQIEDNVCTLNEKLENLSKDTALRVDVDNKLDLLDKTNARLNQKLLYLLEITKSQQQIIVELSGKYSNLCDEYDKQQMNFYEFQTKYQDASKLNDDTFKSLDTRLNELEKMTLETTDFSSLFKVKKTDNMIKKEKRLTSQKKLSDKKLSPLKKEKSNADIIERLTPEQIDKLNSIIEVKISPFKKNETSPKVLNPNFCKSESVADCYQKRIKLQQKRSQRKAEKLSLCESVSRFDEDTENKQTESEKKPKKQNPLFNNKRLSVMNLNTYKF